MIIAAFSMVVDCDGSIDHYGVRRRIRVRMRNQAYLGDWANLLGSLGIGASIHRTELSIDDARSFIKLVNYGFDLHHSIKKVKFQRLLNSYKWVQAPRNGAVNFYLENLRKIEMPISAREFALILGRSKSVAGHYLLKMERRGLVNVNKCRLPYTYSAI